MPVEVNCFILADGAQEAAGKLYVLGGGWDRLIVNTLPTPLITAAIAIVLSVPWNEANETIHFEYSFSCTKMKLLGRNRG